MALLLKRGTAKNAGPTGDEPHRRNAPSVLRWLPVLLLLLSVLPCCAPRAAAQEDELNKVHVNPPPPKPAPPPSTPPPLEGKAALRARANERIRVDVNLVLIPVTVTDPLNRLVTGLEKNEFFLYENNAIADHPEFFRRRCPRLHRHHLRSER